jgi:outer membrane lipoprotein-sorting protein
MKKRIWIVGAWLLFAGVGGAETLEEKGRKIAEEMTLRDEGFGDMTSQTKMVLRNRQGQESTREMQNRTMEVAEDGDRLLVVFDTPRDVKGTAFLSYTHVEGEDDQWLFLPALKRVKRISTRNKSGPFMGSEFAYEDLLSQEVEKYTYKYVEDQDLNGVDCFVSERYPVDTRSGYSKQIVWTDKMRYIPLKITFYDRKGDHLKTLLWEDYHRYEGKHWRAHKMHMVNHQSGKETELFWADIKFKNGLTERDFSQATLKNVR